MGIGCRCKLPLQWVFQCQNKHEYWEPLLVRDLIPPSFHHLEDLFNLPLVYHCYFSYSIGLFLTALKISDSSSTRYTVPVQLFAPYP